MCGRVYNADVNLRAPPRYCFRTTDRKGCREDRPPLLSRNWAATQPAGEGRDLTPGTPLRRWRQTAGHIMTIKKCLSLAGQCKNDKKWVSEHWVQTHTTLLDYFLLSRYSPPPLSHTLIPPKKFDPKMLSSEPGVSFIIYLKDKP